MQHLFESGLRKCYYVKIEAFSQIYHSIMYAIPDKILGMSKTGQLLQWESNPQPLSLQVNIQPFSQTGQMPELCFEYLSA